MTTLLSGQDPLSIIALVALGAFAFWTLAFRLRASSRLRLEQLRAAAEMQKAHAIALEACLDSDGLPDSLKRLLVRFSDCMTDPDVVQRVTSWLRATPLPEFGRARDTEAVLDALRSADPVVAHEFETAIITGAYGAMLRWPETATDFSTAASRMAIRPYQDVVVAVRAAGLGTDFSLSPV